MLPSAAAVFLQAIPVMFIAVFVGEQRISRSRPKSLLSRISTLAVMFFSPLVVGMLSVYVINDDATPFALTIATWLCVVGLTLAMMLLAMNGFAAHPSKDADSSNGESQSD